MDDFLYKYRWYLISVLTAIIVIGLSLIFWENHNRTKATLESNEITELKKQNELLRQELSNEAPKNVAGVSEAVGDKININLADLSELDRLPGIGPVKAQDIIDYREENGQFQSTEELKNINGIGDKTFENLKDSVTVSD